ncbi:MAG: NAD(P)/FAD-dependent oxidoreductase [bacterium]|nr:NAD(P)/FAD-dependent oxidoreductase [bacterium]
MKTIIAGAGINGLLLGSLLSHSGDEVIIFEKNKTSGGRGFLFEKDGYLFDYGIHVTRFGPKSAVAKIMDHIGSPVAYKKMGTSFVIDEKGNRVLFPTGPGAIFKTGLFSLREKFKLLGILLKIKKGKFNEGLMETSLRDWMEQNNISGGIQKYLELVSASVMVCPFTEKTSAGEMFRNIHHVLTTGHSAEYPAGGWQPIHDATIDMINKNGAIHCSSKVEEVIIKDGKAVGVIVKGKAHYADRVVVNLPVQELFSLIPEKSCKKEYVSLCKNLLPTSGVFVDIALKDTITNLDGFLYTDKPITFGAVTSNLVPSLAPENGQIITMFYPTSYEDMADPKKREERKEELREAVKRYFPNIEEHTLRKRETALTMVDGVQVNTSQTAEDRPGTAVPGINNLFLVGDSIAAPGAGGDVGNESVLIAFKEITGVEIG